jgi:hypothetical protein
MSYLALIAIFVAGVAFGWAVRDYAGFTRAARRPRSPLVDAARKEAFKVSEWMLSEKNPIEEMKRIQAEGTAEKAEDDVEHGWRLCIRTGSGVEGETYEGQFFRSQQVANMMLDVYRGGGADAFLVPAKRLREKP